MNGDIVGVSCDLDTIIQAVEHPGDFKKQGKDTVQNFGIPGIEKNCVLDGNFQPFIVEADLDPIGISFFFYFFLYTLFNFAIKNMSMS